MIDSRTILDCADFGANRLIGRGDMLIVVAVDKSRFVCNALS